MPRRLILHLDMDAFFAGIEQAANPALQKRPVVICGDGRSVVATASYEARRFGIRSGQPAREAMRLAPAETAFIPGNHPKYLWVSLQVLQILKKYSAVVEQYSIDEAFLDLSDSQAAQSDPVALARLIKKETAAETGLSCSVGIASNKLLAKIASDYQKPNGLTVINPEQELSWLQSLPIQKLPGVGARTMEYLQGINIKTIGELALIDEAVLIEIFGKNGLYLHRMAWGRDDSPVLTELPPVKSISQEWTMPSDCANRLQLMAVMAWLSALVGRRLRSYRQCGRTVTLKIRFPDFRTISRSETTSEYLTLDEEIRTVAQRLFYRNWTGAPVRLLGIKIANLSIHSLIRNQLSLWPDQEENRKLAETIDALKEKYGEEVVISAANLLLSQGREKI